MESLPTYLKSNECFAMEDTLDEYLAQVDFVSSSDLRSFRGNVGRRDGNASIRMQIGAIFHRIMLEEDEDFQISAIGMKNSCFPEPLKLFTSYLTQTDYRHLKIARDKLNQWSGELFRDWIHSGFTERSIYWKDQADYQWRVRPDIVTKGLVIDLKTFSGNNQKRFLKSLNRNGYLIQAALYLEGIERLYGDPIGFAFLCIDLTSPYRIFLDVLDSKTLLFSKKLLANAKRDFKSHSFCY